MNQEMGVKRAYESEPVVASRVSARVFGKGTDSAEGENEPVNRTNHGWWWPLIAEDAPRLARGEFHHQPRNRESKFA